ncbi:tripartite tricarboxylate transporter substrate binding protein [Variovorax sp. J22P271]|uniref:Bug family tripartite tricarboxylate transporter substrate binding protein n=1 Tax=Variovorax davisae TaxID=3053515 RepID=UPI00257798A1|nr:tripartite tricarboxylate transporter substrate binding protein [Variovorax sp. J22P271]MDM0032046.1 tripartite tricarboxylate transporter substrate binding protein [Variovorax sp. J22P271]
MNNPRAFRAACALVLATLLGPVAAPAVSAAAAWPERPVKLVVPYPAGAGADTTARLVGEKLSARLGQPVVIENRPGAATNIAMEWVVHQPADGYALFFALPTVVQNPYLYKLRFDPRTELRPVAKLTEVSFVLLASSEFPARSVPELLKLAAEKPGQVSCGSPGATPGLGCELLKSRGNVDITVVPYKGNAPALTDLAGGQINLLFDLVSSAKPHVAAGRVRAIATTNSKRGDPQFPELPSVAETLPGVELTAWQGVMVPARTPDAVVQRLERELAAVMADPDVQARLAANGLTRSFEDAARFRQTLAREFTRYEKLIRETGMKGE